MRYHRRMPTAPDSTAALRGGALREAKQALRAKVIAARDAISPAERDAASRRIAESIAALPSFAAARAVLLTLPFRSEWDATLLARIAIAAGKQVAVPRVDTAARVLALHSVSDLDLHAAPGFRGIPEPHASQPAVTPESIEWALVPGVAFDIEGRRLGYGGGYYDRLLSLLAAGAMRVAGAFELQIVHEVPAAPHDLSMDVIVTEARTIDARGS
jgi:5-formyltetrahydrofolate cyclo-ligase